MALVPRSTETAPPGDADAPDAWIRRHQAAAWRYLRVCRCPADVADDLVQEAMLAALHKGIHEHSDAMSAAWLRGAVTKLWCMHLRTQRRRARLTELALAAKAREQCAA